MNNNQTLSKSFQQEVYYTSNTILLEEEERRDADDGELEEEHFSHSFGIANFNSNNSFCNLTSSLNNNILIQSISPSNLVDQKQSSDDIHSGPTIDSVSIISEPLEEDGGKIGITNKSIISRIWSFLLKNIIAHLMIWTNLTLFSGFLLLSPYGLKIFNPIIFSFFRGVVLVISLFPIMLFVDRKFKFRSETKLINRAFAFRKKYPNLYESKYWGWIYSLFYDDKASIPSFILARIPTYKQAKQLAWCGALAVVNQLLFVAGLSLTSSTVTGVMQPLVAVMVCVISMMLGRESKSFVKFFGSIIAVVGAISMLVASAITKETFKQHAMEPDTFDNLSPFEKLPEYFSLLAPNVPSNITFMFGLLCLFGNTFSYSLYLVTQKTLLNKGIPPLTVTFWSFFFGLVVSFLSSLYFFPNFNYRRVDLQSILSVLYAAIPYGALQFSLSALASKLLTPTIVGVYSCVAPVVAILTGVLAFGESPSPWILVGSSLILIGVLVVIGQRYVETRSIANKQNPSTNEPIENQQLDATSCEMEDKSFSSSIITPSSLSNFQDFEEEQPNFKSI